MIFDRSWSSHRQYDQDFLAKLSVTVLHNCGHANKYTGKYEILVVPYEFAPPLLTSFAVHGKNIVSESFFSKIQSSLLREMWLCKMYFAFISTLLFSNKSSLDQFVTCCWASNWKKISSRNVSICLFVCNRGDTIQYHGGLDKGS